ncbi:MAG TPA: DinB family protein [Gemmatimonadales bacterium]|nr:DinB family protein [Gemmatimonadales bacterium]
MSLIQSPAQDEYPAAFADYVGRIPSHADVTELLAGQLSDTSSRLAELPESRGGFRYSPGKWSVKDVVGHVSDTERIMVYRALRLARGDTTPLAGFDQNTYVPEAGADARALGDMIDEWVAVRQATLAFVRSLPPASWSRRGTVDGNPITVRALIYVVAGHAHHHLEVLQTRYRLWD